MDNEKRDATYTKVMRFWDQCERLYLDFQKYSVIQPESDKIGNLVFSKEHGFCHIYTSTRKNISFARPPGDPPNF